MLGGYTPSLTISGPGSVGLGIDAAGSGVAAETLCRLAKPSQQAINQHAMNQHVMNHQFREQRATLQRAAEQRAAEQRAAEQRAGHTLAIEWNSATLGTVIIHLVD